MQLIRGLHNLKKSEQGCVLTIGNFDGIHRGHQAILKRLISCAENYDLPSAVVFFEPHPEELFRPENSPPRMSRFRDKITFLKEFGIDQLILVKFSRRFSQMSAEHFLKEILINQLGVKHLIVGDDFHFGHQRQGNYEYLSSHCEPLGFDLERTATLTEGGERISSTAVRQALQNNDLQKAERLLGRPYIISGKVVHGDKRGRTIGFPTANVLLQRKASPLHGVFAVEVEYTVGNNKVNIFGVANIGKRPTVGGHRLQLEVHLFNWSQDIYGEHITVKFVRHIRAERKFADFEQLKTQIALDSQTAKEIFEIT